MRTRIATILTLLLAGLGFASTASANVCDLTSLGSTCTLGGATFTNTIPQPTGTGFIDPFLRLQNTGSEQGYNTGMDWDPTTGGQQFQFDQKNPSFTPDPLLTSDFKGYTRPLALSEVPIVTVGGIKYREFWLDINEPNGAKSLLSLDQLQIFLSNSSTLGGPTTDYDTSTRKLAGLTAIYDMDAGCSGSGCENGLATDNWVKMDYSLGSGSGSGDMTLLVPDALFASGKPYVYLYSKFGVQGCCTSADGFEEWWVQKSTGGGGGGGGSTAAVPEPASLFLVGTGLAIAARKRRKTRKS